MVNALDGATMQARRFTIPSLDGVRAVAILIVFASHANLPQQLVYGSSGVTIFFFLSGYLITTLLRREQDARGRINLRAFYLRRTLRISPPMYVTLGLALVLALSGVIPDHVGLGATIAAATHLTNYWIIVYGRTALISTMYALWSLAVEEHFYLVFPLIYIALASFKLSRRRQAGVLIGICLAILVWRVVLVYYFHASYDRVYEATDTRGDSILWGCVMALVANPVLDRVRGSRAFWSYLALPAAGLVFLVAARIPDSFPMSVGYTVQALALGVMFTAVIAFPDNWAGRFLNWRPIAYLGVLSYSFYLLHRMAIIGLQDRTHLGRYPLAAAALVMTLIASVVMRVVVEIPSERLRRRLLSDGRPARHAAPGRSRRLVPADRYAR